MIIFKYVELEGFGSIVSKLRYKLNAPGINVLQAANGEGKTTIFSGMSWVLHGIPLKKKSQIQTWPDKRTPEFKGTIGKVLWYNDGHKYLVVRFEKYKFENKQESGVRFYIDDVEDERKGKAEIQIAIIKALGFTHELFKNSVIFGQKMKRIIEEDGPTKKKVFDEAFEIGYIQTAKENTEKRRNDILKETRELSLVISGKKHSLQQARGLYKEYKAGLKNFDRDKEKYIKQRREKLKVLEKGIKALGKRPDKPNEQLIKKLDTRLANYNKALLKIKEVENRLFKSEFAMENLKGDIDALNLRIKSLKGEFTQVIKRCSKCNQRLSPNEIRKQRNQIQKDIASQKMLIKVVKVKQDDLFQEIDRDSKYLLIHKGIQDKINQTKNKYQVEIDKRTTLISWEKDICVLENAKADILADINNERNRQFTFDITRVKKDIKALKKSIIPLESSLTNYNDELEVVQWLIKDPLSNSGIKAFIFDEMLGLINEKLREYSDCLGFTINFGIDLESANKDFYISLEDKNNIRLYEDLSGGEQQLVNICIAFSIHDVICMEKEVNILILDEVFESLDPENIDIVSNLISKKAQGKSVHIVTHHRNFNPVNANHIQLRKKAGKTILAQ